MTQAPRDRPVLLEVLAVMPADLVHCSGCEQLLNLAGMGRAVHEGMAAEYPPQILEEAHRLATWLQELAARYPGRLQIRVLDPQSPAGLGCCLKHGVRRTPAFVVEGRHRVVGWDRERLERALVEAMAGKGPGRWDQVRSWLRRMVRGASEIFYGMTVYDWVRGMRRERGEVERLFALVVFGDLLGLPLLPPYYSLRLLPYVVPVIRGWKRSLLRERDWSDLAELIEGID